MSTKSPAPEKPDGQDGANTPRKNAPKRASYQPPNVKEYGSVAKLTLTKSQDFTDGSSSMSMIP